MEEDRKKIILQKFRQKKLDNKVDEIILHLCNLVDELVEYENEEEYGKCIEIKKQVDNLIILGATQLNEIGAEIPTDEIVKHLQLQYEKILDGVRNFDDIYFD
jgi:seryl-tRNA synthetase